RPGFVHSRPRWSCPTSDLFLGRVFRSPHAANLDPEQDRRLMGWLASQNGREPRSSTRVNPPTQPRSLLPVFQPRYMNIASGWLWPEPPFMMFLEGGGTASRERLFSRQDSHRKSIVACLERDATCSTSENPSKALGLGL